MLTPFMSNLEASLVTNNQKRDKTTKLVDHACLRMCEVRDHFSGMDVKREGRSYTLSGCVATAGHPSVRFPGWKWLVVANVSPVDAEPGNVRIEMPGNWAQACDKDTIDKYITEAIVSFMAKNTLRTR